MPTTIPFIRSKHKMLIAFRRLIANGLRSSRDKFELEIVDAAIARRGQRESVTLHQPTKSAEQRFTGPNLRPTVLSQGRMHGTAKSVVLRRTQRGAPSSPSTADLVKDWVVLSEIGDEAASAVCLKAVVEQPALRESLQQNERVTAGLYEVDLVVAQCKVLASNVRPVA